MDANPNNRTCTDHENRRAVAMSAAFQIVHACNQLSGLCLLGRQWRSGRVPPPTEVPRLRQLVEAGIAACETARAAARRGGLEQLQRCSGASRELSIAVIASKFESVRRAFEALSMSLNHSRPLASDISALDDASHAMKSVGETILDLLTFLGPEKANQDNSEYQSAKWFGKAMAARLRMAARPERKTKRVATRTIDGVVCYSVADARRWWSADVPKSE